MAAFEVLALDPTTPQIRAPGAADTYSFPRAITPSGANVTPITVSGYSLTGANAQSMFDLSGTWNTTGTPTGIKLNVTDTASNAASLLMDLQVGGSSRFKIEKSGKVTTQGEVYASYLFSSNYVACQSDANGYISFGASNDVIIRRDGLANTLAQRNGTNAQTFRVYGTFTDASNYERGYFTADSNGLTIGHEALGTGTKRPVRVVGPSLAAAEAVSILDMSQTWNTTGTPTALKLNVTDTASNAASLLMDLQRGGTTQFAVQKDAGGYVVDGSYGLRRTTNVAITITGGTTGGASIDLNGTFVSLNRIVLNRALQDCGIARKAAGVTEINNGTAGTYAGTAFTTGSQTVAQLPAAATAGAGARAFVTDATVTIFLSTVAGGGANKVPVVSDGTNWLIG